MLKFNFCCRRYSDPLMYALCLVLYKLTSLTCIFFLFLSFVIVTVSEELQFLIDCMFFLS